MQELRVPVVFPEFVEKRTPVSCCLAVVDGLLAVAVQCVTVPRSDHTGVGQREREAAERRLLGVEVINDLSPAGVALQSGARAGFVGFGLGLVRDSLINGAGGHGGNDVGGGFLGARRYLGPRRRQPAGAARHREHLGGEAIGHAGRQLGAVTVAALQELQHIAPIQPGPPTPLVRLLVRQSSVTVVQDGEPRPHRRCAPAVRGQHETAARCVRSGQ